MLFHPKWFHPFSAKLDHRRIGAIPPSRTYSLVRFLNNTPALFLTMGGRRATIFPVGMPCPRLGHCLGLMQSRQAFSLLLKSIFNCATTSSTFVSGVNPVLRAGCKALQWSYYKYWGTKSKAWEQTDLFHAHSNCLDQGGATPRTLRGSFPAALGTDCLWPSGFTTLKHPHHSQNKRESMCGCRTP